MTALPNPYAKYLGPKLMARLEEIQGMDQSLSRTLIAEVELGRMLLAESMALWNGIESLPPEQAAKVSNETRMLAHRRVSDAIQFVAVLVEKMAKVDHINKATLPSRKVDAIAYKLTCIVREYVGDENPALVKKIAKALDEFKVSDDGPQVTLSLD